MQTLAQAEILEMLLHTNSTRNTRSEQRKTVLLKYCVSQQTDGIANQIISVQKVNIT